MKAKVSVVIATYNGSKYLKEQLDSLYNQTLLPFEIIVSDDKSTDDTQIILEEYHAKRGLKYVINDTPLGVNNNFFNAIRLASGDYIAICDQDDVWLPRKIELSLTKLLSIEEGGLPAMVTSENYDIDKDGTVISNNGKKDSSGYLATLITRGTPQGCSIMMNRALCDIMMQKCTMLDNRMMYDAYIAVLAALIGKTYNIGLPLMYYRHHDTNVVGRLGAHEKISLKERISKKWSFPGFMPDERILSIIWVSDNFSLYIQDNDVKVFVNRISLLSEQKSFVGKLSSILSFSQIGLFRRVYILIASLIIYLMRKLVNIIDSY